LLILIPSHPTCPNIVDEEKKPLPHPNTNRKTAQTTKQSRSKARTWDEEIQGEPILTKKENKTHKRKRVVTTIVTTRAPKTSCIN
jgi:hypothetical protein